jgi:uncharacterized membrane protein
MERTPRRRVRGEVLVEMARLKALSDGVVAFALTLLVFGIRVPAEVLNDDLPAAIGALGPEFAVYLLSFVLIGGAWGSHQRMLGQIERADGLLVWWTLLSLLPVTLVPACALLLGDHPTAPVALMVFALDVIAIQLTSSLLWRHAARHRLIDPDLDPRVVRVIGRRLWLLTGCFAVSIPLAFLWAPLAYLAWIATFALVFATDWVSWQQSRRATAGRIPLDGATHARVQIDYGAGLLSIEPADEPDALVNGSFSGGLERRTTRTEDAVDVRLGLPAQSSILSPRFPWAWGVVVDWDIALTRTIPIDLRVDTPGGRARLDLEQLRIRRLELACPGSAVELTLPSAAGDTAVEIQAKGAMVVIHVPDGVAATIDTVTPATGSLQADVTRFPPYHGGHRSPDYETATNRVEIHADVAGGMIRVLGPSAAADALEPFT